MAPIEACRHNRDAGMAGVMKSPITRTCPECGAVYEIPHTVARGRPPGPRAIYWLGIYYVGRPGLPAMDCRTLRCPGVVRLADRMA